MRRNAISDESISVYPVPAVHAILALHGYSSTQFTVWIPGKAAIQLAALDGKLMSGTGTIASMKPVRAASNTRF